ncbi:MAG: hypothetical protein QM783_14335 [Phycisphaerales bacterium]
MRTVGLLAIVVGSVIAGASGAQPGSGGGGGGEGKKKEEPKPVDLPLHRPFDDARETLRQGPTAQRIAVTIKSKGQSPAGANVLLRIAPGKERDQRDAKVSIDAGDLRVYAADGQLTAIAASNPTTYFMVDLDGPPTPRAIAKVLHPLPLPELAVFFAPGGSVVDELTPYTRQIEWQPTKVLIDPPPTQITLNGSVEGKPGASIVFEYQPDPQDRRAAGRLRIRSFTCPITGTVGGGVGGGTSGASEERTLTTMSNWLDPGDPAAWKIATDKRTRVDSLAALGIRIDPPPASTPPASPSPANPTGTPETKPADKPEPEPKPAEPQPAKPDQPKGG